MNSIFIRFVASIEAVFYPITGKAKKGFAYAAKIKGQSAGTVLSPDAYNSRSVRKNGTIRYSPAP